VSDRGKFLTGANYGVDVQDAIDGLRGYFWPLKRISALHGLAPPPLTETVKECQPKRFSARI
jgi:hypothetical protein